MTNERTTQAQFELMVSYMEQNGDMHGLPDKVESHIRWVELSKLLNNKALGESKPISKWKKCWSDYKNNVKKKEIRIKRKHTRTNLTEVEKRVLQIVENEKINKRQSIVSDNENTIEFKPMTEPEEDPFPTPQFNISDVQPTRLDGCDMTGHIKSSRSSTPSVSSYEETPNPGKRGKSLEDNIKDIAYKYLEFERERERLAHEREMARIKQNDQLILIFGKIVNVLETLTPNVQKCLDRGTNDTNDNNDNNR